MAANAPQATVRLQKSLSVRRSGADASEVWWSLPWSLRRFCRTFAADIADAEACVDPTTAVDVVDAALLSLGTCEEDAGLDVSLDPGDVPDAAARPRLASNSATGVATTPWRDKGVTGVQLALVRMRRDRRRQGRLWFSDVEALLGLVDQGRVAPCRITIQAVAGRPFFHIEVPHAHTAQLHYRFLRAGDAVRALQDLALGRSFGPDAAALEHRLLQHPDLSAAGRHTLALVLQGGGAVLEGTTDGGRRRVCYLQVGRGYRGTHTRCSRWTVGRARLAQQIQRFPVNVVLFAGLPVFIAFFRFGGFLMRRLRP